MFASASVLACCQLSLTLPQQENPDVLFHVSPPLDQQSDALRSYTDIYRSFEYWISSWNETCGSPQRCASKVKPYHSGSNRRVKPRPLLAGPTPCSRPEIPKTTCYYTTTLCMYYTVYSWEWCEQCRFEGSKLVETIWIKLYIRWHFNQEWVVLQTLIRVTSDWRFCGDSQQLNIIFSCPNLPLFLFFKGNQHFFVFFYRKIHVNSIQ